MKDLDRIRLIECDLCRKRVSDIGFIAGSLIYKNMISQCLCPECSYWKNIANDENRNVYVINEICFDIQPFQHDPPPGAILGGHGKVRYIITDDGDVFKSNDVWRLGTPPAHLRYLFARKARFMKRKAFNTYKLHYQYCNNSDCLDRYHCFFYDWKHETSGKLIPLSHIVGSEMCKSFLNLNWIENFDYSK